MRPFLLAALALAAAIAGGCGISAHRTQLATAEGCATLPDGALEPAALQRCGAHVGEHSAGADYAYTLYFPEFDDQGWSTIAGERDQLEVVIDAIRERLQARAPGGAPRHPCLAPAGPFPSVHILLYVHGWKHDAAPADGNVLNFRRMVKEAARAECVRQGGREVSGIYVGWRGKAIELGPLNDLNVPSFWTRKNTAAEVAQGRVRELFARIDAIADAVNARAREARREKAVRMLLVGHSFGAHVLLTSLGGSVLRNVAAGVEDTERCRNDLARDGDMMVLVNPAIEGTRFEALYEVARKWRGSCYKPPLFVAVTSDGDWATRSLFPLGRIVSTVIESYPQGAEEREADRGTFANRRRYQTHRLETSAQPWPEGNRCAHWAEASLAERVGAEYRNAMAFFEQVGREMRVPRERRFCAGTVLTRNADRESWDAPIVVATVSKDLVKDHNAIYGERFMSFLRELYMDTLISERQGSAPITPQQVQAR